MAYENRGQCHYCGESNSYTELTCTHCSTRLPWADALMQSRQVAQNAIAQPVQTKWAQPPQPIQYQAGQVPAVGQHNFCAHCGASHAVGASFCSHCGTPVQAFAPMPLQATLDESHRLKKPWGLLFRANPTPAPVTAIPTATTPVYMMPHMAHMPQQPAINVSVVTQQNTTHSSGWWARLTLFLFKASMVFAFLFGIWLALVTHH